MEKAMEQRKRRLPLWQLKGLAAMTSVDKERLWAIKLAGGRAGVIVGLNYEQAYAQEPLRGRKAAKAFHLV
jgi:hypothetical protein